MKVLSLVTLLWVFVITAKAALPPASGCLEKKVVTQFSQIASTPKETLAWDCLELSELSKNDLVLAAGIAPKLSLKTSTLNLDRTDFDKVAKAGKVDLLVDSKKFGRTDLFELIKAGVNVTISLQATEFNIIDLQEIANAGPIHLIIDNQNFSFIHMLEIAEHTKVSMTVNNQNLDLTEAQLDELSRKSKAIKVLPKLN